MLKGIEAAWKLTLCSGVIMDMFGCTGGDKTGLGLSQGHWDLVVSPIGILNCLGVSLDTKLCLNLLIIIIQVSKFAFLR